MTKDRKAGSVWGASDRPRVTLVCQGGPRNKEAVVVAADGLAFEHTEARLMELDLTKPPAFKSYYVRASDRLVWLEPKPSPRPGSNQ